MTITLGKTYKDKVSGFEGIAIHRTEFLYACERVCLQTQAKDGDVKECVFDAPQLELQLRKKSVVVEPEKLRRTGGTRPGATRARSNAR
jgi:hypothetical protein